MTLAEALRGLVKSPGELLVRRWNWKAAVTSSVIRGIIFFAANLKSGLGAAAGAMIAEYAYRGMTSGFYGAITQQFGEIEPEWQGAVAAAVVLPVLSHSLELTVHWLRHTPHLKVSIISSVTFTVFSTLFNVYAMKRGALTVGSSSRSLGEDLRAMPRMIGGFIAALPLIAWRSLRSRPA